MPFRHLVRFVAAVAVLFLSMTERPLVAQPPYDVLGGPSLDRPHTLVSTQGAGYAYAPSIIHENGTIHLFYCSNGPGANEPDAPWDYVRSVMSQDGGATWSAPRIVLSGHNGVSQRDRAAGDPAVVRFQNEFYLFYTGNAVDSAVPGVGNYCQDPAAFQAYRRVNPQISVEEFSRQCGMSAVFVAKAPRIEGPYSVIQDDSGQAQIILARVGLGTVPSDLPFSYGAGQPSAIAHDDQEILLWVYDDSGTAVNNGWIDRYRVRKFGNLLGVVDRVRTNVQSAVSPEVKYDPASRRYLMFYFSCLPGDECAETLAEAASRNKSLPRNRLHGHHMRDISIVYRESRDGITFGEPRVLFAKHRRTQFAHNLGIGSDARGYLLPDRLWVAYGAVPDQPDCYRSNASCWARWDLDGFLLDRQPQMPTSPDLVPPPPPFSRGQFYRTARLPQR